MNRQSSRSAPIMDAIDCSVNVNEFALENEVSRRDKPSKRSNETRVNRHSPPSVTRKRHASPPSMTSSSAARSHHQYYPSQRHYRGPSPSPPPQPSSRHHRPAVAVKRPHTKSRSPYERRPPTHRSRPESSKERTINDIFTRSSSTQEQTVSKKMTPHQEPADLSLISEDETSKLHDFRSNSTTANQSPFISTNNKLHSTPSLPILQPNPSENLLDMSNISQDYDISLFAKSALSTTNSFLTTPMLSTNDCLQTIDLISRYKSMQALPCNNPVVETCSKDVLKLIQKQIELQKIELNHREREIKLRERELAEREKRFNERSNNATSTTSHHSESTVGIKPTSIEEKPQPISDIIINQDMKAVSQDESVINSISPTVDTTKANLSNKTGLSRKNSGKSRFSQITVDPSIFSSQQNPKVDLYSDDHDDNQLSLPLNTNNSLKKTTISKILAPTESTISIVDADLKVTSSNSCRKVEFQSGNIDKTATSKGPSHDLRLTLSKNRTKQQNNDDTNGDQLTNDEEQTITMSSKTNSNKDDKQQSHDYHQQRSITSTSIETSIDNIHDKRDNRRQQQRNNSSRQQQYAGPNSSSSTDSINDRTYTHGPSAQQSSKYGSNQKRHESDDLRARLFEHKPPKSSRTTHRNDY